MARHRARPRRGQPGADVLVEGDVGEYHPQGGARLREVFRESGDLESREFGVPEADLPGGKGHVINPETEATDPAIPPERPADYHKYHGVPSDDGLYVVPDGEVGESERPAPVPKIQDAVPVYIVEGGGKAKVIRALTTEGPMAFPTGTVDPIRLATRDPKRTKFWITNENLPTQPGAAGTQGASVTTVGSVTSPAADATITSQALAAGVYTVGWTVQLSGTLGAGDANNFVMESNNVQVAQSLNSAAAGTYTQPPVTVVIPAGGATVEIEALAIGTTGAVYTAQMTTTPVPSAATAGANPAGVRIGTLEDAADNRGLLILGNSTRDFNTQEALYMTNQSGSTVTLSWGYETEIQAAGS